MDGFAAAGATVICCNPAPNPDTSGIIASWTFVIRQLLVDRPDLSGARYLRSGQKGEACPDVDLRAIVPVLLALQQTWQIQEWLLCWQLGIIVRLWRKQILLKRSSA